MTDAPEASADQRVPAPGAKFAVAESPSETPQADGRLAPVVAEADRQKGRDYEVGYRKPPKANRFKPGSRGNPKGRPRGSLNKATIIERALAKRIPVRKGDKTVREPVFQVIAEKFTLMAADGDHRALMAVINLASKSGTWSPESGRAAGTPPRELATPEKRPSDRWVESIDENRLSDEEKIALSILAEKVDSDGDVLALTSEDFALMKKIVSKGRGQSQDPASPVDRLDQAA